MPLDPSPGLQTILESGAGAFFAAAMAFYQGYRRNRHGHGAATDDHAALTAAHERLDRQQADFVDRLVAENNRYRRERDVWEAHARRMEKYARDLRHMLINERMRGGSNEDYPEPPDPDDPAAPS